MLRKVQKDLKIIWNLNYYTDKIFIRLIYVIHIQYILNPNLLNLITQTYWKHLNNMYKLSLRQKLWSLTI